MYHPSRGGVRGGADQFDWENVKTDKHRENYLGHSLKAPVGRWQKGKDLLWYSKDRLTNNEAQKAHILEMARIKKAEEEAMLVALGHKIVKEEVQPLTKEEMAEAFKRNNGQRDSSNVERVEGVGMYGSSGKSKHHKGEKKYKKKSKSDKEYLENSHESSDHRPSSKRPSHKHSHEHRSKRKSKQGNDRHSKRGFSEDRSVKHWNKKRHDSSSDSDSHSNVNSSHKSHKSTHNLRNHEDIYQNHKVCNNSLKKKRHDSDTD